MQRLLLAVVAVVFGLGLATANAKPPMDKVYDPNSHKWIDFDPSKMQNGTRDPNRPDPQFARQIVPFRTSEKPGTIIIDTDRKFLFYVLPNSQAIRYGIGVGREGFGWAGEVHVQRKAEWPTWTPPADMQARDPDAAKYADGMPGGPDNPLGARAMYLYNGRQDSLYRIHGTNAPWSIGKNVSSGCIRMLNQDVIDLYNRVKIGTPVFVLQDGAAQVQGS